jgi:hypothetical protein
MLNKYANKGSKGKKCVKWILGAHTTSLKGDSSS